MKRTAKKEDLVKDRKTSEIESLFYVPHDVHSPSTEHTVPNSCVIKPE